MVPRVVLRVLMPCLPIVATLTIEAFILKDVEEAVAILVHALIKFLLLVLVFLVLVLTFPSIKFTARKAM